MRCLDTLDLGLPVPEPIARIRRDHWFALSDAGQQDQEHWTRTRVAGLRRRMLRIAREECPATRQRKRRGSVDYCTMFRDVCYHEAGHAVAGAALGGLISSATVLSPIQMWHRFQARHQDFFLEHGGGFGLVCEADASPVPTHAGSAFVACAGPAAELMIGGTATTFFADADVDLDTDAAKVFQECRDTIDAEPDDPGTPRLERIIELSNWIWTQTCRFVADPRTIASIDAVAALLRDHHRVRGAEIEHIIERNGVRRVPVLQTVRPG